VIHEPIHGRSAGGAGIVVTLTAFIFAVGAVAGIAPATASGEVPDLLRVLGDGVVGNFEPASTSIGVSRLARWETGEWRYRITSGGRRGQTEVENLAPIGATARGETWKRTIGRESTLYLRETVDGSLVLPSQITHPHHALVYFEPPLSYLIAGMGAGESQVFEGRMEVYSANNPGVKWYTGRIRATTVHGGVYRITTPAGVFRATLIKTEYEIEILAVVVVHDTLYTFYAEGVGKVAEAEHRRIAAMGLFSSDTKSGKVLVSYPSAMAPSRSQEAP